MELRYDYGDAILGTCLESLKGGNHFRLCLFTTFVTTEFADGTLMQSFSSERPEC